MSHYPTDPCRPYDGDAPYGAASSGEATAGQAHWDWSRRPAAEQVATAEQVPTARPAPGAWVAPIAPVSAPPEAEWGRPQQASGQWRAPQQSWHAEPDAGTATSWQGWVAPPAALVPGSLGKRFLALVIDSVLIQIAGAVALAPLAGSIGAAASRSGTTGSVDLWSGVLAVLYLAIANGVFGCTLGKLLTGLRVVDVETGERLGWWRGLLRQVVLAPLQAVCGLGYLTVFTDSSGRNRGWHDLAARSCVVEKRR